MKKFHFSHGHLYFSEKHLYFTTDITIFQSIFYKLVIFFFRLRLEYAPPYSTQSSYICVHLSYALKVFLRSASFSCGNALPLHVPGCVFDWNTSMLPYNFPRMGMHFPVIPEACSLLQSFPHKAEGPAARRMQAASPFAIDTVPSGPSLPGCPPVGFTALAASILRRNRCRNCRRNRRCRRNHRSPLRWAQQRQG